MASLVSHPSIKLNCILFILICCLTNFLKTVSELQLSIVSSLSKRSRLPLQLFTMVLISDSARTIFFTIIWCIRSALMAIPGSPDYFNVFYSNTDSKAFGSFSIILINSTIMSLCITGCVPVVQDMPQTNYSYAIQNLYLKTIRDNFNTLSFFVAAQLLL